MIENIPNNPLCAMAIVFVLCFVVSGFFMIRKLEKIIKADAERFRKARKESEEFDRLLAKAAMGVLELEHKEK